MDEGCHLLANEGNNRTEATQNLFNTETHLYILKHGWEILIPADKKEEWHDKFQAMTYDSMMKWPQTTTYNYIMGVLAPPFIPSSILHFGYAVLEDKLIRSAFYVVQNMVDYQVMPQGMVIDPLAFIQGVKPSFYVGCSVDKKDIESFLMNRKNPKNPLEEYVRRTNQKEHEKRIYDSHIEGYFLQMNYQPDWFSEQLMEFAVEQDLHIPHSSHNDELRASYERAKKRRESNSSKLNE
jgi:hypothetical protein